MNKFVLNLYIYIIYIKNIFVEVLCSQERHD